MSRTRPRLYALTVNPALDLSGHVTDIVPNEKNPVYHSRFDPGGNAINAARIAYRLGVRPTLFGFIGGAAGQQLDTLLQGEGLKTDFVSIDGTTRTNVTVTNLKTHQQTRLTFPGPSVRASERRRLLSQISGLRAPGILMIGGSVPPGLPENFVRQLIRLGQIQGLGVVVDVPATELRKVLAKPNPQRLLLLKPNQAELAAWAGRAFRTPAQVGAAAIELLQHSALVCVSLGKDGAVLAHAGRAWKIQTPRVKTRGSVGAGDSLVGAMVAYLAKNQIVTPADADAAAPSLIRNAAQYGAAAGAATATTAGTALGSAILIRKLLPRVRISALG